MDLKYAILTWYDLFCEKLMETNLLGCPQKTNIVQWMISGIDLKNIWLNINIHEWINRQLPATGILEFVSILSLFVTNNPNVVNEAHKTLRLFGWNWGEIFLHTDRN